MNRAFQIACENALAPLLVERLRRATKAMGLNAQIRHGQTIIIRNQRAELERKAQEIHDLQLELVKIKSEWVDAKGLSLERGREIEKQRAEIEALKRKVREISKEYVDFHKKMRTRERKRLKERRLLIAEVEGKFAKDVLKRSAQPLSLVLNKPVKRRKR